MDCSLPGSCIHRIFQAKVLEWGAVAFSGIITKSYTTPCNPVDYNPTGSSVHGDSPGKNAGVGCHALLQRIFPNQGLDPGLPHYKRILYHLNHQEPKNTGVGSLSLLQRIFLTQESNWNLLHCRQILYQLSYQGSPKSSQLVVVVV